MSIMLNWNASVQSTALIPPYKEIQQEQAKLTRVQWRRENMSNHRSIQSHSLRSSLWWIEWFFFLLFSAIFLFFFFLFERFKLEKGEAEAGGGSESSSKWIEFLGDDGWSANERQIKLATQVGKWQNCKIEETTDEMSGRWDAAGMRIDYHGCVESANDEVDSNRNVDVHTGHYNFGLVTMNEMN